ncbi:MAG: alpha/beta-hydrolase family protein [Actinomycetota bacterium]|nr:alpha/beta-hydrolase family protein [Actinomycetota bacterium]
MSVATQTPSQENPEHSEVTAVPKRRVFTLSLSGPGIAVAAFFFASSLQPSLLPRAGAVQGLASGITAAIGYGIGAGGQSLWTYLQIPKIKGRARTLVLGVIFVLIAWSVAFSVWRQVGWQNEIRELFGMKPVSYTTWPAIIIVMALVFALILIVSRALRLLFSVVGRWLARRIPRRLAIVLSAVVLLILFWSLITGVLVNGFFNLANTVFSSRDGSTAPGIEQPALPELSGSPASLVKWDELGRQGRNFVASGPTAADINEFSGGGALEPIRSYVGLKSAATLQARADLLLEELKRAGAFDRQALVLTTTTGTGFLDPAGVDPVEYIFNGDIAVAGVQYSYLPSWISLLADQDDVKETSQVVFDTIHDYWADLPASSRPKLYLYGLSLGSFGVESVLNSIDVINEPIDGAVMSGPPFVNPLHSQLVEDRKAGTPEWLPIYGDGRTVRFMAEEGFASTPGPWGPTRLVYIQHGSDPVVFFSPSLAWSEPDWLKEGQRPPDVAERMTWFPLVTFWQVAADLPGAAGVPKGYGHEYSWKANTEAWVAVANLQAWTLAKTQKLVSLLEKQAHFSD